MANIPRFFDAFAHGVSSVPHFVLFVLLIAYIAMVITALFKPLAGNLILYRGIHGVILGAASHVLSTGSPSPASASPATELFLQLLSPDQCVVTVCFFTYIALGLMCILKAFSAQPGQIVNETASLWVGWALLMVGSIGAR